MKLDQSGLWTGTWRDPRGGAFDAGRPENSLTGQLFRVNFGTTAILVPAAYGKWPFWRNTDIATLPSNAVATLAPGTLGYEWDENFDGSQPTNSIDLSATTLDGAQILLDAGATYGTGSATHHLNLYRAPSGALVFGAGTVQWSWGLDSSHDGGGGAADVRMQQATDNLLTDMGARAATQQPGLVSPTPTNPLLPSGDTQALPPRPRPSSADPNAPHGEPSGKASTAGCLKLTSTVTRLRIGRRTVLRATVRRGGRAVARVRVVLSGGAKTMVRRSDRHGRVSFIVRPRHTGTLRLRGPKQRSSCKAAAASIRVR
jgi:hypothetical protein